MADTANDYLRPSVSVFFMRGFILVSHSLLFLPVSPILSLPKHYIVIYRCATVTCTLLNVHLAVAQHTGGRCAAVSKNVGLFQGIRIITCVFSKDSINGKKQDAMITFIQRYCIVQDLGHTCNIVHGVRH